MKNLITILLLLFIFLLPMLTSLLLNWAFIQQQIARQIVVYLLMITEALVLIIVLIQYLKQLNNV